MGFLDWTKRQATGALPALKDKAASARTFVKENWSKDGEQNQDPIIANLLEQAIQEQITHSKRVQGTQEASNIAKEIAEALKLFGEKTEAPVQEDTGLDVDWNPITQEFSAVDKWIKEFEEMPMLLRKEPTPNNVTKRNQLYLQILTTLNLLTSHLNEIGNAMKNNVTMLKDEDIALYNQAINKIFAIGELLLKHQHPNAGSENAPIIPGEVD